MTGARSIQQIIKNSMSALPLETVENFPPYWQFGGEVSFLVKGDLRMGLHYNMASTGGKLHYGDYSGEISSIQLIHRSLVGVSARTESRINRKGLSFEVGIVAGINSTTMDLLSKIDLHDIHTSEQTESFKNNSLSLLPEIGLKQYLGPLVLKAFVGGEYTFDAKVKPDPSSDGYLADASNKPINFSWNSLRTGVGVGFSF
ncbi:hypothetical protein GCM10023331_01000 [Algivirga pacifica]|uniref:Outer membrane protein beta-barrel domain-containing protein n=2 Tax=Algivirga pacifica TaxID=1162670 RepID=A0ABP9CY33_9BACT